MKKQNADNEVTVDLTDFGTAFKTINLQVVHNYPVLPRENNFVIDKSYPYGDVRRYGAIADGKTDCTQPIQNAINCNKKIYVPGGDSKYITTSPLYMFSNQELYGDGEASIISNITPSGANRIVLMCGFFGESKYSNSPKEAPYYPILRFKKGSREISVSPGNISKFNVGDIVLIRSEELGDHNPLYQQIDEVLSVNLKSGIITLKYGIILNGFIKDATNIANLTRYDNMPNGSSYGLETDVYIARNVHVHDLFLEQAVDHKTSGWYVIFTACYESRFENIKIYGSTPVGSNLSALTTLKNIYGNYHGAASDNCEFQYMNVFDGLRLFRINSLVNADVGFTINNGAFNVLRNSTIQFGGVGAVSCVDGLYTTIENCTFIDGYRNGAGSIMGCTSGNMTVNNCTIICHENSPAMSIYDKDNTITGNTFINCGRIPIVKREEDYYEDSTIKNNHYIYHDEKDAEIGGFHIKGNHDFAGGDLYEQACVNYPITSDTDCVIYSNKRVRYPVSSKKTLTVCMTLPPVTNNFRLNINGDDAMEFTYTPEKKETLEIVISFVANSGNMRIFCTLSNGKFSKYTTLSIGKLKNRYFLVELLGCAGVANTMYRNYFVME